ncbi:hypothetical protein HKCCE4037_08875 [Rhodobacterales bacterium HKCCE4037]|nr:hypothetical protein [Rhodobacterales bacterium HKCCE4037]
MTVVEDTPSRLVVTFRQQSFLYLALGFLAFGIALCAAGIAGGQTPLGWSIGFAVAGAISAIFLLGIERHSRITFDAASAELVVTTRQFWRDTTFRAPLSDVSDIIIESRRQGPKTLFALRFLDTGGEPHPFRRYIEPGPKVELPLVAMQGWIATYHGRTP